MIADAFPVLNALKDVHLILAEGAHNQFGDLAWTARAEMLDAAVDARRPEFREFLGGRAMVPYREPWMDRVDTMKQIQGWGDASVTHFRDLAVFGEQLLLSIRYGNWSAISDSAAAANWARDWRTEVQTLHARLPGGDRRRSRRARARPARRWARPGARRALAQAPGGASATHARAARGVHAGARRGHEYGCRAQARCLTSHLRCTWGCGTPAASSGPGRR